jgi:hypothetical protein
VERHDSVTAGVDMIDPSIDIIAFLDDDVELRHDYLAAIRRSFRERPEIVFLRGHDRQRYGCRRDRSCRGAGNAGYRCFGAWRLHGAPAAPDHLCRCLRCNDERAPLGLAACAVRRRLPLYSYMEDLDFAAQCAGYRRQACCHNARLVHLYTRGGRLAGSCIGFAQVMNPSYLWLKGTCPTGFLLRRVARHVAANIVKSRDPRQSSPDRRARLSGNLVALGSILRGHIAPENDGVIGAFGEP